MIRRYVAILMSAAMLAVLPAGAGAQAEPTAPESQDWSLTSYLAADEFVVVPFGVEATLLLADGAASGSGGCNTFRGSYVIDGASLAFSPEMVSTLMLCTGDAQAVEDAYLPLLLEVAVWSIDEGVLSLSDETGEVMLTYEVPSVALTESQLDALIAELRALREEVETLRGETAAPASPEPEASPVPAASATPTPAPTPVAFSGAEEILLEGVVRRIARTCEPLRRSLPAGAVAAVTCSPAAADVRRVNFYLMDQLEASQWFHRRMTRNGIGSINEVGGQCADGYLAVTEGSVGPYSNAQGCFVDSSGRANVHYLQSATDCKVIRAGGERLSSPVIYIAVVAEDDDIRGLTRWTERGAAYGSGRYNQSSGLTQEIERPRGAWSPGCPVS